VNNNPDRLSAENSQPSASNDLNISRFASQLIMIRWPLLWGKAEKVQPGEEKVPGRPYCSLPVPEGSLQESWRGTFYKGMWW